VLSRGDPCRIEALPLNDCRRRGGRVFLLRAGGAWGKILHDELSYESLPILCTENAGNVVDVSIFWGKLAKLRQKAV
jgi:hypothetical protein